MRAPLAPQAKTIWRSGTRTRANLGRARGRPQPLKPGLFGREAPPAPQARIIDGVWGCPRPSSRNACQLPHTRLFSFAVVFAVTRTISSLQPKLYIWGKGRPQPLKPYTRMPPAPGVGINWARTPLPLIPSPPSRDLGRGGGCPQSLKLVSCQLLHTQLWRWNFGSRTLACAFAFLHDRRIYK